MTRPGASAWRSSTVHVTDFPLTWSVTVTTVPKAREGLAHVPAGAAYHDATPVTAWAGGAVVVVVVGAGRGGGAAVVVVVGEGRGLGAVEVGAGAEVDAVPDAGAGPEADALARSTGGGAVVVVVVDSGRCHAKLTALTARGTEEAVASDAFVATSCPVGAALRSDAR
jgi:hypothetical protein